MDTLYNYATLVFGDMKLFLCLTGSLQNLLVSQIFLVFFVVCFDQLIKNLSFFQSADNESGNSGYYRTAPYGG